ncbi:glutamyl-tRNA reductase [Corynebacterium sp. HMSC063A05]|uniref:glutamyl-tRNA reductase n=1 Tax=Corynebacterium TaxID=1716 RepID=UPI0006683311|nr:MULTISPECIES: glutamyl-tRNA reductase [Corynebacterium]MDK8818661.1 glutamyl-tRNA reductase [Corynebacterium amycolatum]OFM85981.1 glutamyl-tRNA reductase [Corynebacterium sp. HMSC063A05]
MSVLLVGMSYRSAPVTLLEKVSVGETEREAILARLVADEAISEAMLLSTCNRVEYYVVANGFHSGLSAVVREIVGRTGLELDELTPHLYVRYAQAAAEHAFSVCAGLDSMVLGEQQIIGQIRNTYQEADEAGTVGRMLHDLAQKALHTGKRVHSETLIDNAGASMVSVAIDEAVAALQPGFNSGVDVAEGTDILAGRSALILGAGAMSSLAASYLGRCGIDRLIIANRTVDRAQNLANHSIEAGIPATAIALHDFADVLDDVDILVSATGAMTPVVSAADVIDHGPLAIVDLSMPRDVAEDVSGLEGIALFNIELLQMTRTEVPGRDDEAAARDIVAEELESYLTAQRASEVAPTVRALRERAADVAAAELARLEAKTPGLTQKERREVESTVRRVVDKLLHAPTVQVKKLSSQQGGGNYALALQKLFDLPLSTPSGLYADTDIPADLMVEGRIGRMQGFEQYGLDSSAIIEGVAETTKN